MHLTVGHLPSPQLVNDSADDDLRLRLHCDSSGPVCVINVEPWRHRQGRCYYRANANRAPASSPSQQQERNRDGKEMQLLLV